MVKSPVPNYPKTYWHMRRLILFTPSSLPRTNAKGFAASGDLISRFCSCKWEIIYFYLKLSHSVQKCQSLAVLFSRMWCVLDLAGSNQMSGAHFHRRKQSFWNPSLCQEHIPIFDPRFCSLSLVLPPAPCLGIAYGTWGGHDWAACVCVFSEHFQAFKLKFQSSHLQCVIKGRKTKK